MHRLATSFVALCSTSRCEQESIRFQLKYFPRSPLHSPAGNSAKAFHRQLGRFIYHVLPQLNTITDIHPACMHTGRTMRLVDVDPSVSLFPMCCYDPDYSNTA